MREGARPRQPDEMFCPSCGVAIKRDVQFCPHCGAGVATAAEAASWSTAGLAEPGHAFSSCKVLARFVVGALALVMIMDVVGVISGIAEVRLVTRMINGEFVTLKELEDNDNRQAVVGGLQLAILILAAILFLVWIYRAHRNLPALGVSGLKYSPNWAVGGWFIPIMNLWRPYQVTAEIWRASDPESSGPEGQAWQTAPVSPILKFWWGLWIIGGIIGSILLRFAFQEPEDLEALRTQSVTFAVADVIDIPAAILAILVIWYITTRQEERHSRLQGVSWSG